MKTSLLFAVLFASIAGCSSSDDTNAPPVIDSIDGPAETTLQTTAQGQFHVVTYVVKFHDDDNDAITKARFRIADLGIDQSTAVQNATAGVTQGQLLLGLPVSVPKKAYDVVISAIDARGGESAPVTKNVTVK